MSLQIENLCDSRRIKIEGDLVDELARLPRSLADMYALILENIGQIEQRGRTVAETIFKWLLCTEDARSQVTIAACSGTIATDCRRLSIPDILDVCSTLVIYDEAEDRFRFAHLSIQEFFESQPGYTPSNANRFILERSLQALMGDQSPLDLFRSYATFHWYLHYHRLVEQHRKEAFELHAKRFLFSGVESSEFFENWAVEAPSQERSRLEAHRWPRLRRDLRIRSLENGGGLRNPVNLASCLGWLEILDHFEASQNPDDFRRSAMTMMEMAIRRRETSVVRWLVVRDVYPTDGQLVLAVQDPHLRIIRTLWDTNIISFNTRVDGEELLVLAVRKNLWHLYKYVLEQGADRNFRDQHGRTRLFHAVLTSSSDSEISTSYSYSRFRKDLLLARMDSNVPGSTEIRDGGKVLRRVLRPSPLSTCELAP